MGIIDNKELCEIICYACDVLNDLKYEESLTAKCFYIREQDYEDKAIILDEDETKAIILFTSFIFYDNEMFRKNKIYFREFSRQIYVTNISDGGDVTEPLSKIFSRRAKNKHKENYYNRKAEMQELLYIFDININCDNISCFDILLKIHERYSSILEEIIEINLFSDYYQLIEDLKNTISKNNLPFSEKSILINKAEDRKSTEETRKLSYIEQMGTNLNEKKYDYDPAIGRDEIIKQIAITLCTPNQSVMLIGPAGTGKSAIAEGLAYRIKEGKYLKDKKIIEIDTSSLVSGKMMFGAFEENLQKIVKSAEENPEIILFIDEIHRLYKLGINESNAMNNLKKPISDGKIRIIGATTKEEYEDTIKEDSAFVDRFDIYTISELSDKWLKQIVEARINWLEEYYNIALNMNGTELSKFIDYLLKLTSKDNRKLNQSNHNPRLVIQLLDKIFATASINGNFMVGYDDVISAIMSNDKISYKNYKMPDVFNDNENHDAPKSLANVIDFNSFKRKN